MRLSPYFFLLALLAVAGCDANDDPSFPEPPGEQYVQARMSGPIDGTLDFAFEQAFGRDYGIGPCFNLSGSTEGVGSGQLVLCPRTNANEALSTLIPGRYEISHYPTPQEIGFSSYLGNPDGSSGGTSYANACGGSANVSLSDGTVVSGTFSVRYCTLLPGGASTDDVFGRAEGRFSFDLASAVGADGEPFPYP